MRREAHVSDLLPAYALGCLDNEEAIQVDEHLATCSTCRAELTAYQDVADQLALAAPDVLPPAGLKNSRLCKALIIRLAISALKMPLTLCLNMMRVEAMTSICMTPL